MAEIKEFKVRRLDNDIPCRVKLLFFQCYNWGARSGSDSFIAASGGLARRGGLGLLPDRVTCSVGQPEWLVWVELDPLFRTASSDGGRNTCVRECAAMAKRGRKRDLNRELRYWELLSQGIGTIEACRLVGGSKKTGYRWRAEMGAVLTKKPATSSGRYLSLFRTSTDRLVA